MVKFIISDDLFWGYQFEMDIETFNNYNNPFEQVILYFKNSLAQKLENLGLINLVEKLQEEEFHIHNVTEEEVRNNNIVYICSHCSQT